MFPRVAIIYLCHNNRSYLPDVFESLARLNYPRDQLEIVVVDNDSKDGSQEWLRQQTGITFLPSATNLGFAEGNNLGMRRALLGGVEFVYLLNGDAKLDPDAIMEAMKLAQSNEKIGAVQSRIMLWKHPEIVNVTGGMVHFLGFGFARDNGKAWDGVLSVHRKFLAGKAGPINFLCTDRTPMFEVAYASGAAVLYRASVLREVGLLDSFLFLYHEDLELGWRIRLAGYRCVLAVDSIAYHDYEFKRSIQKFYWMERNRVLVHFSHLRLWTLLLLAPFLLATEIGLIAFAIKGGWIREKLLVYINLLSPRTWIYVARKRRESRFLRRVSDREMVRLWTGKIEHQETSSPVVDRLINPFLNSIWFLLQRLIR
ncbi:MAG: glycosyltransferase family 2 protein [Candidatus Uhrbacteria bacterium]|nr:glycosyltransferase family 2 protein [Candidatus Uhrbacteria bacterium]